MPLFFLLLKGFTFASKFFKNYETFYASCIVIRVYHFLRREEKKTCPSPLPSRFPCGSRCPLRARYFHNCFAPQTKHKSRERHSATHGRCFSPPQSRQGGYMVNF